MSQHFDQQYVTLKIRNMREENLVLRNRTIFAIVSYMTPTAVEWLVKSWKPEVTTCVESILTSRKVGYPIIVFAALFATHFLSDRILKFYDLCQAYNDVVRDMTPSEELKSLENQRPRFLIFTIGALIALPLLAPLTSWMTSQTCTSIRDIICCLSLARIGFHASDIYFSRESASESIPRNDFR